jgi:hypothetical protein
LTVTQPFALLVWAEPKDIDSYTARGRVAEWVARGGDPAGSPFEPSTDVAWFHRELANEFPEMDLTTDAQHRPRGRIPPWLAGALEDDELPPARVVGVRLADDSRGVIDSVFGLALKYDLVLFDPQSGQLTRPHQVMSAHASATFWPAGAIRSVLAGVVGIILAVCGWVLGIPIIGWLLILIGAFLVVLSVATLVAEGRKRLRAGSTK